MNIKTIRRNDWTRVLEKQVIIRDLAWEGMQGKVSLLKILKVSSPLAIDYGVDQVTIVDAGYSWVQIAWEGQYYWITSMFDEHDRLAEIYIDMTDGNHLDAEDPWFRDMFLDYVVHVRKDLVMELDRDELDQAYENGGITQEQYLRTLREGEKVLRCLRERREELEQLLIRVQRELKRSPDLREGSGNGMNGEG